MVTLFVVAGNIALHLFTKDTREHYDLESLWALGPEMDRKAKERDYIEDFLMGIDPLADLKHQT